MGINGIDFHQVITDGAQQIEARLNGEFVIGTRFRHRDVEVDIHGLSFHQLLALSDCEIVEDRLDRITTRVCQHLVLRMVESGAYFLTVEGDPERVYPPLDVLGFIADKEAEFSENISREVDKFLASIFENN